GRPVASVCPLPQAQCDEHADEHQARERGRVPVETGPVLVAIVTTEPANGLAAPADEDDEADAAEKEQREHAFAEIASDPEGDEARDPEKERERRQEPLGHAFRDHRWNTSSTA